VVQILESMFGLRPVRYLYWGMDRLQEILEAKRREIAKMIHRAGHLRAGARRPSA